MKCVCLVPALIHARKGPKLGLQVFSMLDSHEAGAIPVSGYIVERSFSVASEILVVSNRLTVACSFASVEA
jgi:hypothetical protein